MINDIQVGRKFVQTARHSLFSDIREGRDQSGLGDKTTSHKHNEHAITLAKDRLQEPHPFRPASTE